MHDALDALGRENQWPTEALTGIHVALEEHLTNVISYGYESGKCGRIAIRFDVHEQDLKIVLEDDGRPFNPLERPAPELKLPLDQRPVGGLGIHFLRQLTDAQEYRCEQSRNVLTLRKRIG